MPPVACIASVWTVVRSGAVVPFTSVASRVMTDASAFAVRPETSVTTSCAMSTPACSRSSVTV